MMLEYLLLEQKHLGSLKYLGWSKSACRFNEAGRKPPGLSNKQRLLPALRNSP